MFGSHALDIIVGLLALLTLLGVCVTTLTESIQTFCQKIRAKHLEQTLTLLLVGQLKSAAESDNRFLRQVLEHPLIQAMAAPDQRPSYLEPALLADAILDVLLGVDAPPDTPAATEPLAALQQRIEQLSTPYIREALSALLRAAAVAGSDEANPLLSFKARIEHWIDAAMVRAEGRTKRHAKLVSLGCSLALCLALNFNAFDVMKGLIQDSALREAAMGAGVKMAMENNLTQQFEQQCAKDDDQNQCRLSHAVATLQALPHLALGWDPLPDFFQLERYQSPPVYAAVCRWLCDFLYWLLGILAATMAASLGGDFWFKLLGQAIRLTGAKTASPGKP